MSMHAVGSSAGLRRAGEQHGRVHHVGCGASTTCGQLAAGEANGRGVSGSIHVVRRARGRVGPGAPPRSSWSERPEHPDHGVGEGLGDLVSGFIHACARVQNERWLTHGVARFIAHVSERHGCRQRGPGHQHRLPVWFIHARGEQGAGTSVSGIPARSGSSARMRRGTPPLVREKHLGASTRYAWSSRAQGIDGTIANAIESSACAAAGTAFRASGGDVALVVGSRLGEEASRV
jgi:hypothetical protein